MNLNDAKLQAYSLYAGVRASEEAWARAAQGPVSEVVSVLERAARRPAPVDPVDPQPPVDPGPGRDPDPDPDPDPGPITQPPSPISTKIALKRLPITSYRSGGDSYFLQKGDNGRTFQGESMKATTRACLINDNSPGYIQEDITFKDCAFEAWIWGARLYDVRNFLFENSLFWRIQKEHGTYLDVVGDVTWRGCQFVYCAGQAIQTVFRGGSYTSDPALGQAGGTLRVEDCDIHECGSIHGGRSAFGLTFFDSSQDVEILRTDVVHVRDPLTLYSGKMIGSHGAINLGSRPRTLLDGLYVNYFQPGRALVLVGAHDELVVENSHFEEGNLDLTDVSKLTWRNCTGNAVLRIRNGSGWDTLGPVHGDYAL